MNESTPLGGETPRSAGPKEKIMEKAAGLASSAKEQAQQQFDRRVSTMRSEITSFAKALRDTERTLRGDSGSQIGAALVGRIADRLESVGSSLDGKDIDAVVRDIENFARRSPAAFLGGAAAIGFFAARFVKSTSHRSYASQMSASSAFGEEL